MTPEQRRRAGRAVAHRMMLHGMTLRTVAQAAGVHPRTVRRLLQGEHWPTDHVRIAIETALGWAPGVIVRHALEVLDTLCDYSDAELAAEMLRRARAREDPVTRRDDNRCPV